MIIRAECEKCDIVGFIDTDYRQDKGMTPIIRLFRDGWEKVTLEEQNHTIHYTKQEKEE